MQHLPNIDKSAFRRGEYVGYADGVWRITRRDQTAWVARHREGKHPAIVERTLADISGQLGIIQGS